MVDADLRYERMVEERDRQDKRLAAYTRIANKQKQVLLENNIEPPKGTGTSELNMMSGSDISY